MKIFCIKKASFTFSAAIFLAFSFQIGFSQEQNPLCSAEYARMIVDQQASELNLNTETPQKIRILIGVADFLWDLDQTAARKYFSEARRLAVEYRDELKTKPKKNDRPFMVDTDYEMSVVSAIAKRDPKWAQSIFEQILKDAAQNDDKNSNDISDDNRLRTLLTIASANASSNPDLSLSLFRLAIANFRFENSWIYALFDAAKQNRPLANRVAIELLKKNADADPSQLLYGSHFALGLPFGLGLSRVQIGVTIDKDFVVDPLVRDTFLSIFLNRTENFLSNFANLPRSTDQPTYELVSIYTALDGLQTFLPTLSAEFQRRVTIARSRAGSLLNKADRDYLKNQESRSFGRSIDERIAALEAAEKENKLSDDDIVKAIFAPTGTLVELQRFQPWIEKIKSEETRAITYSYYWYLLTEAAIKEDSLNDAQRFAEKVAQPQIRAALMFKIAKARLKDLNNITDAYEILSRVSAENRKAPDSADKAAVYMGLANVYSDFNASFAISEFSDAVKVLNKSGPHKEVPGTIYLRISTGTGVYVMSPGSPEFSFTATIKKLSDTDIGLTLSNVKALEDPYLRSVAVISAMSRCVDKQNQSVKQ